MTVLVVLAASVVAIGVEEEDDVEVLAAEVAHSKHGMMAGKYHDETVSYPMGKSHGGGAFPKCCR